MLSAKLNTKKRKYSISLYTFCNTPLYLHNKSIRELHNPKKPLGFTFFALFNYNAVPKKRVNVFAGIQIQIRQMRGGSNVVAFIFWVGLGAIGWKKWFISSGFGSTVWNFQKIRNIIRVDSKRKFLMKKMLRFLPRRTAQWILMTSTSFQGFSLTERERTTGRRENLGTRLPWLQVIFFCSLKSTGHCDCHPIVGVS